jgi:hypothetical protein
VRKTCKAPGRKSSGRDLSVDRERQRADFAKYRDERLAEGPAWLYLSFIAEDLRASKTKAQRLELAAALDRLVIVVVNLEHPLKVRRGRPASDKACWTKRKVSLAFQLVTKHSASPSDAVAAVTQDKAEQRLVGRYLRQVRADKGKTHWISYNKQELQAALRRLPHRIK